MQDFYRDFVRYIPDRSLVFLNYGFFEPSQTSSGPKESDHYHLSLLNRVLGSRTFGGDTILEIGCGRGGNCSSLATRKGIEAVVGLDLCFENVEFCRRVHRHEKLQFLRANSASLPFLNARFDLVLNLESAHCYDDFPGFVGEVKRVLKPGGSFCFADLWDFFPFPLDWREREESLKRSGLETVHEEDIGEQVLNALRQVDGFTAELERVSTADNRSFIDRIINGNRVLANSLASGDCRNRLWRFRKPG